MFNFLRTSKSLWKSRLSLNPELLFYRVRFQPSLSARRWGLPVVAVGLAGGIIYYNKDLVEKIVTKDPWHMPLWFMHPTKAEPYDQSSPELTEYKELMQDAQRRVNAESAVLQAVKQRVASSSLDIGHWEGFASPFWMTFRLANPPPGWARKYLAISSSNIEIVTRPVTPRNVMRLSVIFYPRATAAAMQAFSTSVFESMRSMFSPETPIGTYKPPTLPLSKPPRETDGSEKGPPDVPLLPSGVVMALHEAASDAHLTLTKELSRDYVKNLPPPPRGWIVADGTVRIVGSEIAIIFDFRVAFNPKNPEQRLVYDLNPRHHTRRRGMQIKTFEKPSIPPPPPPRPDKQQQEQVFQKPTAPVQPPIAPEQQQTRQKPAVPVQPPVVSPEPQQTRQKPASPVQSSVPPEQQREQEQQQQQQQEVPRKR
ncbi:hypothetical protein ABW20_dc0103727 [Dactylellina cionopaga]|nr:hypothetical protein ABW20_dc0103727 [Dactylellina cionopaga]